MKPRPCPDRTPHARHPLSRWRDCPGVVGEIESCWRNITHGPHWHGEDFDQWCRGLGLAGVCEHGTGILDECKRCDADRAETDVGSRS